MMKARTSGRYCSRCGARLASDNAGAVCSPCRRKARHEGPPALPPDFWDADVIRDALARRHMGRVVRAYRHHPYHGWRPLPQHVVGGWLGVSQEQLSRYENGPPIRDLDILTHWAGVLRIPPRLLWFFLPGGQTASAGPSGSVQAAPVTPASVPCDRGGSDGAQNPAADMAVMRAFRTADRQLGGGHLYATVADYLQAEVAPRLVDCTSATKDEQELFAAAGGLSEMAAWMAHDAGRDRLAHRHFSRALSLAWGSGDVELSAHVLGSMSHLARHLDRTNDAIRLARDGQATLRHASGSPGLTARLLAMEARGFAALLQPDACVECLQRAERALQRTPAEESSEWISRFDEASLAGETARCMQQLGQASEARRQVGIVMERRGGDSTRSRALAQMTLAAVLLEQGKPDEACEVASGVLRSTQALGSYRVVQEVQEFRQTLDPHQGTRVVGEFLEHSGEALRQRMWLYRLADGNGRASNAQNGTPRW